MSELSIRPYTAADIQAVVDLQLRYAQAYPGSPVIGAEIYGLPAFAGGANILCAWSDEGRLLGYAPLFPMPVEDDATPGPHRIWTAIKPDPDLSDPAVVQDALYEGAIARTREIQAALPPRPVQLSADYLAQEAPAIAYLRGKGWFHRLSTYQMVRDLNAPIPEPPVPAGVTIREWPMRTEEEQNAYLQARNSAFPQMPWTFEYLQHFLQNVLWPCGPVSVTALAEGRVVGSVLLYWDPHENERLARAAAFTEEIFCVPDRRGQGIASACIAAALRVLKAYGMTEAHLGVGTLNAKALTLYERLGYRTTCESVILSLDL